MVSTLRGGLKCRLRGAYRAEMYRFTLKFPLRAARAKGWEVDTPGGGESSTLVKPAAASNTAQELGKTQRMTDHSRPPTQWLDHPGWLKLVVGVLGRGRVGVMSGPVMPCAAAEAVAMIARMSQRHYRHIMPGSSSPRKSRST